MEETNQKNKKKFAMSDRAQNIIFDCVCLVCIIIVSIAIVPRTMQNDTFYNIKCGEFLFQNGIFGQTEDPFSWHNLSYTWPHWLFDLLLYFFYSIGGVNWEITIYLMTIAFTVILGISMYVLSMESSKKNRVVSFILTLLGLYLMKDFVTARAQLVTFILFIWEIFCIEKLLKTNKKRWGAGIVLISFLVANLHAAMFPMVFIFALPYIVEYLYVKLSDLDIDEKLVRVLFRIGEKFFRSQEKKKKCKLLIEKSKKNCEAKKIKREKKRRDPYKVLVTENKAVITLMIFLILALLVGFLNPMGTNSFTYTIKTFMGNTTESINEHLPLTLADNMGYAIFLTVLFIILILANVKVRLSDLFMIAGTVLLSFMSVRNVSLVIIMCVPILARLISEILEKYDNRMCDWLKKLATSLIGVIVIIVCCAMLMQNTFRKNENGEYVDSSTYPVAMTEWLKEYMEENEIDAEELHLYNEYNYGSYLLFNDIPVFIDSRADLYSPEFGSKDDIFTEALSVPNLNSSYEKIFEKYDVRYVMLTSGAAVNNNLHDDENYELLRDDGGFVLWKRLNAE